MNPSGYRIEEKKQDAPMTPNSTGYKSTHSSRSSVLERAREYNRRVEQKDMERQRSKSLERGSAARTAGVINSAESGSATSSSYNSSSRRSQSAGRARPHGNQPSTRERAMASVRHDTQNNNNKSNNTNNLNNTNRNNSASRQPPAVQQQQQQQKQQLHSNKSASVSPKPPQQQPDPEQQQNQQKNNKDTNPENNGVVTPELLVDALSGHEDGLLAIAEKLMEHYDQGYDVMGEAIIDAFADVQKLFQHVVEAAHMEGAAFEASRRDEELQELRQQVGQLQIHGDSHLNSPLQSPSNKDNNNTNTPNGGPQRHDEFIDQDVQDVLTDAIRQGTTLLANNPIQCCQIYEKACQDASSLLPVDSDHRGRLQLSLARAESMSSERACAILRYAMDDVLRSGRRALNANTPLPDVSQRADVVLNKGGAGAGGLYPNSSVVQSSEEALASLQEEMKEILSAPIYNDTPLQAVAQRFWTALQEAQKLQKKNSERLEQNLGKLKGEFLLARAVRTSLSLSLLMNCAVSAMDSLFLTFLYFLFCFPMQEWEEKLNHSTETAEIYKQKYQNLKESVRSNNGNSSAHPSLSAASVDSSYLGQAKSFASRNGETDHLSAMYGSVKSAASGKAETVASGVSGLAAQARTIVMNTSFNCTAPASHDDDSLQHQAPPVRPSQRSGQRSTMATQERSRSRSKNSRAFREYSRSPQRVDV